MTRWRLEGTERWIDCTYKMHIARVGLEGQTIAEYLLSGTRMVESMEHVSHRQNTRMADARVRP